MYRENPKTKGSGIMCAIPQKGRCPNECEDCFFQSGRSYLEPLDENTPNMPPFDKQFMMKARIPRVIRINDGNDSNVDRRTVIEASRVLRTSLYFFNTSIPDDLEGFPGPVVLTVNPGKMTDLGFHELEEIPLNLMFVRFRANTWNQSSLRKCVAYYTSRNVPVVVTFMAYFDTCAKIPVEAARHYAFRKRTLNSYYAITTDAAEGVMRPYRYNKLVYQCGKIEGERGDTHCRYCGNCIREYFVTMERLNEDE